MIALIEFALLIIVCTAIVSVVYGIFLWLKAKYVAKHILLDKVEKALENNFRKELENILIMHGDKLPRKMQKMLEVRIAELSNEEDQKRVKKEFDAKLNLN